MLYLPVMVYYLDCFTQAHLISQNNGVFFRPGVDQPVESVHLVVPQNEVLHQTKSDLSTVTNFA